MYSKKVTDYLETLKSTTKGEKNSPVKDAVISQIVGLTPVALAAWTMYFGGPLVALRLAHVMLWALCLIMLLSTSMGIVFRVYLQVASNIDTGKARERADYILFKGYKGFRWRLMVALTTMGMSFWVSLANDWTVLAVGQLGVLASYLTFRYATLTYRRARANQIDSALEPNLSGLDEEAAMRNAIDDLFSEK